MGALKVDVEKVIKSKSEDLYRKLPRFVINYLKKIIHQDEMNSILAECGDRKGISFTEKVLECLGITYTVHGLENLKDNTNCIYASNHPLGGLDGMIAITALGEYFPDIKFVVNDLLMNIQPLQEVFVPINKHGNMSKDYAARLQEIYSSSMPVYNFPAGLCSRRILGRVQDPAWKRTFVNQAKKYNRPIVPIFFSGRNSRFFYNLSKFRKAIGIKFNIEMIYLPDEMFKQRNRHFDLYIGTPISCEELNNGMTSAQWTEEIRNRCYKLGNK